MANKSGNAYGLTVLCPILPGLPKQAPDGMNDQTHADLVRLQLQRLAVNELSPMARVPNTYLSRLWVLDDVPYQGRPAVLEYLKSNYLVFSSNFYGELDDYLRGMWTGRYGRELGYYLPSKEMPAAFRRAAFAGLLVLSALPVAGQVPP